MGLSVQPLYDCSPFSPESNLAVNHGKAAFPDPLESDNGWGGGSYKWHIIDGIRIASSYWTYGLAFTGGSDEYIDTCGWRQATVNFCRPVLINRTVVWLERDYFDEYSIQYWDEISGEWNNAIQASNKISIMNTYIKYYKKHQEAIYYRLSLPFEDTFPVIQSQKIRFAFNNCIGGHGWINEFEVYYDKPGERPECLVIRK